MNRSYDVTVAHNRIFVNGRVVQDISSNRFRLVGVTEEGFIVKADHLPAREPLNFQTRIERDLYPLISKKDRSYFPEIIASGFYYKQYNTFAWIIEKAVKFIHNATITLKARRTVMRLSRKYFIYDLGDLGPSRVGRTISHDSNWGIVKYGVPVIFDFGAQDYMADSLEDSC